MSYNQVINRNCVIDFTIDQYNHNLEVLFFREGFNDQVNHTIGFVTKS